MSYIFKQRKYHVTSGRIWNCHSKEMQFVVACKNVSPLLVPSLTELEHPECMTDPGIGYEKRFFKVVTHRHSFGL